MQTVIRKGRLHWLSARARRMGLQLDPRAAHFLTEYCGTHLATLAAELDKAAAWAGEGGRIGMEAVEETVGRGRVHTVFELADALGERRGGRALNALGTLLDAGEAPLKVQGMITRQFRLIARAREVLATGNGNLAREVGVPPFVANKLGAQARKFTDREIQAAFARFARVDQDLKGGALPPRIVLEREVMGLCGTGQRAAGPGTGPVREAVSRWR
ncbi:MAG: DNA polymerase III subunit delta [Nitrospirota bacterium]|nr:DNA polymerase III subunit delta [Nitrospirota bacterium]